MINQGFSYLAIDHRRVGPEAVIEFVLNKVGLKQSSLDFIVVTEDSVSEIRKRPFKEKFRVFFVPEVEQYAKSEALLKAVEEPRPYQIFILHTYNYLSLSRALVSRCLILNAVEPLEEFLKAKDKCSSDSLTKEDFTENINPNLNITKCIRALDLMLIEHRDLVKDTEIIFDHGNLTPFDMLYYHHLIRGKLK